MIRPKMNKYMHLIKNTSMLLIGNFVTKVLSFFMVPFYTALLSTSDYGTADLISNIVLLTLPIFSLLMDEAIMRFTLDYNYDRKMTFSISLIVSTLGFFVALCISPALLFFDSIRPYYLFVVLYYIVSWLYNLISNYVKGLDKVLHTTIAGLLHTIFYIGLNIFFLATLRLGIRGYLLAVCLSNLMSILYLVIISKAYNQIINPIRINWKQAKEMLQYSLPMIPNYISWWINNASDKFILTFFCGASKNGIYSVAYKIPSLLSSITSIFGSAWRISSVNNFGSKESVAFYNKVYSFYSGMLLIGASALIIITKPLASILFAKSFFSAWKVTPILILAYVFSALAQFVDSVFSASKQTKTLFYASLTGAVVNTILNFVLVPFLDCDGAAIATLLGYITIWIVDMVYVKKIFDMNFNLSVMLPCMILLILEIIVIRMNRLWGNIIACVFGGIITIINKEQFVEAIKMIYPKIWKGRNQSEIWYKK